ncbi:MAG: hypothetical protein NC548_44930 [Lachnospiraceae bacterium]|nr:hypothetical protein [Lachnospiraceae bacterium]MCM1232193.1 hypothetical protein [Ruminococcus flavefaciens]
MANSLMQFTQQPNMGSPMSPEMLAQQGGMNMPQMLNQIRRFKSAFKGNPKQQVMSMVQQGMRSNEQLQQAMQMAQQFRGFF